MAMNNAVQLFEGTLSVITRPVPHVQTAQDVVIKITNSGISGTDLKLVDGKIPCAKSVILGHEFVGVVKEVGAAVRHVTVGDRVAVNPRTSCDMCDYCQRGQPQFCKIEGISTAIGINRNGGWAQFCRLQARHVFPLPHQMSLEQGLFLEPFSSIVHGWEQLTPISPDAEILVCGCGATGLLWMCLLYFRGFREVVATEITKGRTRVAQKLEFGYQIVHPDILVSEARNAENEGDTEWGFDVVVDCTGDAAAIGQAFRWLRPGGKLLAFKNCPPDSQITINPRELQKKELQILASYGNPFSFTRAVQLVQDMGSQYLNYEKLGIRTFQLQEYHAAIECLRSGEITKAVIEN